MNDFLVVEEMQIVSLQDQWFITQNKATSEIKAWVKKAVKAEKKLVEKQNKVCEQAKAKS